MIDAAVAALDSAIIFAQSASGDFVHGYFNGLKLNSDEFVQLCHSYAARFLAHMPRTEEENADVDWQRVLKHAEKGLQYNFAPIADGKSWTSYHQYVFAETGLGPFWASR